MPYQFPDISPIALQIGPLAIRWYALAYLTGFVLSWLYASALARRTPEQRPNTKDIEDFLFWAVLGVILGGRMGYVFIYQPTLYLADPLEAFKIWHGGMSFHGGALGVILAMIYFARRHEINPFRLADIVCACVPIGLFFGRIANFINAELYGRITTLPWGVIFPNGGPLPRHPSQIYESLLEGALLFIILFVLIRQEKFRERPGFISGVFLFGYGIFRGFIELVREPDSQIGLIANTITMGQILCLPMILGGTALAFYAYRGKTRHFNAKPA